MKSAAFSWPGAVFYAALAGVLVYGLLFTGGSSHGGDFNLGTMRLEYSLSRTGILRFKSVDYCLIMAEWPPVYSEHFANNLYSFNLKFSEKDAVSFTLKSGQTIWLGHDHKPRVIHPEFGYNDLETLKTFQADKRLEVTSPEELRMALKSIRSDRNGLGR